MMQQRHVYRALSEFSLLGIVVSGHLNSSSRFSIFVPSRLMCVFFFFLNLAVLTQTCFVMSSCGRQDRGLTFHYNVCMHVCFSYTNDGFLSVSVIIYMQSCIQMPGVELDSTKVLLYFWM